MSKYLVLNPMNEKIESEMEKIRRIVSPHVSKGKMASMRASFDEVKKVEAIESERVRVEAQGKRLYHAVVALLILAAVDISLHWLL